MKLRYMMCALLWVVAYNLNATTIYVRQDGVGAGTSWADATGDLSAALFAAQDGDQVWVAKGIYYPTKQPNRRVSFNIPSGVRVYGGFYGNESALSQRVDNSLKSILSGNIGNLSDNSDNSYTVVYLKNSSVNTILDGFIITDGMADGVGPSADRERCGAGLYVDGAGLGNISKPRIQNCLFQNNIARDGGAIYVNGRGGTSNPVFIRCDFQKNKADLDGGAIFSDGRQNGIANAEFYECNFSTNQANYGGAICNYGGKGQCNPTIQNCIFRSNEALLRGGAIFNMDVEGEARPIINDTQFVDNQAVAGEVVYTFSKPIAKESSESVKFKAN